MIYLAPAARADIERVREFLGVNNPEAAKRALATIFTALQRLEEFSQLGVPTEEPAIRQLIIPFGASAYIARYTIRSDRNVLALRLWHGREART